MQGHTEHANVTSSSNTTGFVISLMLTLISFGMVASGQFSTPLTLSVIVTMAVLQVIAQMHFFLHLDTSSGQRWNLMSLIYTLTIIVFLVVGTLWIMYNTGIRMMPMMH